MDEKRDDYYDSDDDIQLFDSDDHEKDLLGEDEEEHWGFDFDYEEEKEMDGHEEKEVKNEDKVEQTTGKMIFDVL